MSQQKGNISNYAKTQNSFNGNNDSIISVDRKSNYSFQNDSYQSQNSSNRSVHNDPSKNSSAYVSPSINAPLTKQANYQSSQGSLQQR